MYKRKNIFRVGADKGQPFFFIKEESMEGIRKLSGEKQFLSVCHRLQTALNFNKQKELWMTIDSDNGKSTKAFFSRETLCKTVFLPLGFYRYGEVFAACRNGSVRSMGWVQL